MSDASTGTAALVDRSVYADGSGNTVTTEYRTTTDADGNVTGYVYTSTTESADGYRYESTSVYDAAWRLLESRYSDSTGNSGATEYLTTTDADGNVTGSTQVSTSEDAKGYRYESTSVYDADGRVLESSYSDSAGNSSSTRYLTTTDADGNITGSTQITTSEDASGYSYESETVFAADGRVLETRYTDSRGNSSSTEYLTTTDADGNVTGYTYVSTSEDANGYRNEYTTVYDAAGRLLESSYADSLGNRGSTEYLTETDADGNVTGTRQVTTSEDANGNRNESTLAYDAAGRLLEVSYSDSLGNSSRTEYTTRTDADGNVTGSTQVTTAEDASGFGYTSTVVYDAAGRWLESSYSDTAGNRSTTEQSTGTDADGNVTGYTQVTSTEDANGYRYQSTAVYDASWRLLEASSSDSAGNSSSTSYEAITDAGGNVTGYTQVTTAEDANGFTSTSTTVFDAEWRTIESSYTDSAGSSSATEYRTLTDADGNVTGYSQVTTSGDASGFTNESTTLYDAAWRLLESTTVDSAGNSTRTVYETTTDDGGNVTAYRVVTTTADANGVGYVSTVVYGADGQLVESTSSEYAAVSARLAASEASFDWSSSDTTAPLSGEVYALQAAMAEISMDFGAMSQGIDMAGLMPDDPGAWAALASLSVGTANEYMF